MSADNIFFEDSEPYENLQLYKEFCWQKDISNYF
jgi:hypothetical protein